MEIKTLFILIYAFTFLVLHGIWSDTKEKKEGKERRTYGGCLFVCFVCFWSHSMTCGVLVP